MTIETAAGFTVVLGPVSDPVLLGWNAKALEDPSPQGLECESWALRTPEGVVLIEPKLPAEQADDVPRYLEPLLHMMGAPLLATAMTTPNHERAMYLIQERYGAPAWGPAPLDAGALSHNDAFWGTPTHLYPDGDTLPGGLQVIQLDRWVRGDSALLWTAPTGERVLFTGDAVCLRLPQLRNDQEPRCLHLSCRRTTEHPTPQEMRSTFGRLLDEDFAVICPGHNGPLGDRPGELLTEVVERGDHFETDRMRWLIAPAQR